MTETDPSTGRRPLSARAAAQSLFREGKAPARRAAGVDGSEVNDAAEDAGNRRVLPADQRNGIGGRRVLYV